MRSVTKSISATEAVRRFSELLNSIKYKGERYTILRGGKAAASIGPAEPSGRARTLADLKEIMGQLPSLGDEAARFEKDLRELVRRQPRMPRRSRWE